MPRLLELFSGTKSVSTVAKELGWSTLSLDLCPRHTPDLCMDILEFDETEYSIYHFDFIWASVPCESYSRARTRAKIPRDEAMKKSDKLMTKTRQIIEYFGCLYCIENPDTSLLWTRDVSAGIYDQSAITSYCSFGYPYRKNTRIVSNFPLILSRCLGPGKCPMMVGRKHLECAQKGGGGHMPSYKTTDQLHRIPRGLILAILSQLTYEMHEICKLIESTTL